MSLLRISFISSVARRRPVMSLSTIEHVIQDALLDRLPIDAAPAGIHAFVARKASMREEGYELAHRADLSDAVEHRTSRLVGLPGGGKADG